MQNVKKLTILHSDDMLNLSVEMEALTPACKRDGLLEGECLPLWDGDGNIALTL